MTTLVIGARGRVGREVLRQLVAAGEPVRASVRDLARADLPAGVPVVAADLTRPDTLPAALDGVRQVFLYANVDGIEHVVTAAEEAGVEHVVLLSSGSVLVESAVGNAIAEEHRQVERALAGSSLRWTPIRPLVLANNALNWSYSIRAEGVVRLAHPDAVSAPIHERDIAAVAVAALRGSTAPAVRAMLTGGELLTQRQQIETIARAIGRPVQLIELSDVEYREHLGKFMPAEFADAVLDFLTRSLVEGSPVTGSVQAVLGRAPVRFAAWAAEHAGDFR